MPHDAKTDKLESAFLELVDQDPDFALQLITGMFVGFTTAYMAARGYDQGETINIESSNGQRAITIHAINEEGSTDAE
jgi:hypothetical protein